MKNKFIEDLFTHIKHGDEVHQKWLYDELYTFINNYNELPSFWLNDQEIIKEKKK